MLRMGYRAKPQPSGALEERIGLSCTGCSNHPGTLLHGCRITSDLGEARASNLAQVTSSLL